MPSEWRSVLEDYPHWGDDVSRLELKTSSGNVVVAIGGALDAQYTGEDEIPIVAGLRTEDGATLSIVNFEWWRTISQQSI